MIGIVILNYNSWELTIDCIQSIFMTLKEEYKIYVVDNLSTITMPSEFKTLLESNRIQFIEAQINKGYSAGNNLGLIAALNDNCEYLLISNSDIVFHDFSIEKMKNYLSSNKDVGIVGPKIYLSDGQIQDIDMLTKTTLKVKYDLIFRKTWLKYIMKKNTIKFSKSTNDLDMPFVVHSVSGCCFMMNKNCAEYLVPLDEKTFLYEEEVIIGVKMEQQELKTVYLTDSEITHYHGQTTKNLKAFSYIEFVRSEIYYLKNYLKNNNFEIILLILIRFLKYFINMFINKDYRKNFKRFFSRGLEFF